MTKEYADMIGADHYAPELWIQLDMHKKYLSKKYEASWPLVF